MEEIQESECDNAQGHSNNNLNRTNTITEDVVNITESLIALWMIGYYFTDPRSSIP